MLFSLRDTPRAWSAACALQLLIVFAAHNLAAQQFPRAIAADKKGTYQCFVRVTKNSSAPEITIGLKNRAPVEGKPKWSYSQLEKALASSQKSKAKSSPRIKNLRNLSNLLNNCFKKLQLPSPASPGNPAKPTVPPTVPPRDEPTKPPTARPTATPTPQPTDPPVVTFESVRPIIQARCMSCHVTTGAWQNTSEWLIANGRVAPGNLAGSNLYTYLAGNPDGLSPAYMPKGLAALPATEIQTIRAWILSLPPSSGGPRASFSCDPSSAPVASSLKRLARVEYVNTVYDLLRPLSASDAIGVWQSLQAAMALVPVDSARTFLLQEQVFHELDLRVTPDHINAYYSVATTFGQAIAQSANRIRALTSADCVPDRNTPSGLTCAREFISRLGMKTQRRPLTTEEAQTYEAFFAARPDATAVADLIARLLLTPQFLYHVELDGSPVAGTSSAFSLSAFELANRLAYTFWQSAPDDALQAAALDGSLLTTQGYNAAVERVFADVNGQRTEDMTRNFFNQSLNIETLPALNPNNEVPFRVFAGEDIPAGGQQLEQDMQAEIDALTHYYVWETDGSMSDLLLSQKSFTQSPQLARLYGVAPWQPGTPQPTFPAGERAGILSRAALLVSGTYTASPLKRGARMRREILCDDLPDPDFETMNMVRPPAFNPTMTTRERFTEITRPAHCMSCHARINPLGFTFEMFDSLGRFRRTEKVIASDGSIAAEHPIDAVTTPEIVPGDARVANNPTTLIQQIAESGKAEACFSRKYFRFVFRRHEDLIADGCALEAVRQALTASDGSLKKGFKAIALQPGFKTVVRAP